MIFYLFDQREWPLYSGSTENTVVARSLPQKIGISMWGTELKVRASPDGKLSDLFCWKTLATGHHLPAMSRFRRRLSQSKRPRA